MKRQRRNVKIATIRFDPADYLDDDETRLAYLNTVLAEGDPGEIVDALGTIARARGMSRVARRAGLGRESLYKALAGDGNPGFRTILRVAAAMGYTFEVRAALQVGRRRSDPRRSRTE